MYFWARQIYKIIYLQLKTTRKALTEITFHSVFDMIEAMHKFTVFIAPGTSHNGP